MSYWFYTCGGRFTVGSEVLILPAVHHSRVEPNGHTAGEGALCADMPHFSRLLRKSLLSVNLSNVAPPVIYTRKSLFCQQWVQGTMMQSIDMILSLW